MGSGCGDDAAGSPGVFRGVSEGERSLGCAGFGLSVALPEPERAVEARWLATVLLSNLADHWRYAHITALRGDGVNPALLGMSRVVSEDSVRRGLERIGLDAGAGWLQGHLDDTVRPLLSAPWILDCDTTIKPLYGHQEGPVVGYNPKKPGRPSHTYHAFVMAGTRLVLEVAVAPGDRQRSKRVAPSLWALLGRLGRKRWPRPVRGDKDWGSEANMASCERAGLDYLFKLRLTKGARRLAERVMASGAWEDAGGGWSGCVAELRLHGWSRKRRVVVLRRRLPGTVALARGTDGQGELFWADAQPDAKVWEFTVLATSLNLEPLTRVGAKESVVPYPGHDPCGVIDGDRVLVQLFLLREPDIGALLHHCSHGFGNETGRNAVYRFNTELRLEGAGKPIDMAVPHRPPDAAEPFVNRGRLDQGAHHVPIFAVKRKIAAVGFEQGPPGVGRQLFVRRPARFEQGLVNALDQGPEQVLLVAEIPVESAERYPGLVGNVDHLEGDIPVAGQHFSATGQEAAACTPAFGRRRELDRLLSHSVDLHPLRAPPSHTLDR